jgi:hypothetical protein
MGGGLRRWKFTTRGGFEPIERNKGLACPTEGAMTCARAGSLLLFMFCERAPGPLRVAQRMLNLFPSSTGDKKKRVPFANARKRHGAPQVTVEAWLNPVRCYAPVCGGETRLRMPQRRNTERGASATCHGKVWHPYGDWWRGADARRCLGRSVSCEGLRDGSPRPAE